MRIAIHPPVMQLSSSRQFLLIGLTVVVASMLILGLWLGRQIEHGVVMRTAGIAATYVESVVEAQLSGWSGSGPLPAEKRDALDRIFSAGPLSKRIVGFTLWAPGGLVAYNVDHGLIGRRFAVDGRMTDAFAGNLRFGIQYPEDRHEPEAPLAPGARLLEVYVPLASTVTSGGHLVAEFDHSMTELDADIGSAQLRGWAMAALCALAISAVMYGRINRATSTILGQQREMREQLAQLKAALDENQAMRLRLSEAGQRTTTLNEQFLNRIAADLHDGPAQDLAYVLLRFDDIVGECINCTKLGGEAGRGLIAIHQAMRSSLDELRAIAAGLGIPGIEEMSLSCTAARAVADAERTQGAQAVSQIAPDLDQASQALKITLYRVIREALSNAWRHGKPAVPYVGVQRIGNELDVEIHDDGPGFDPAKALASGRLGLLFMRERVRLAGGQFEIVTGTGRGTVIRARIPLAQDG